MKTEINLSIFFVFVLLSSAICSADQQTRLLKKNPFIKPTNLVDLPVSNNDRQEGTEAELVLRATLTSINRSIANVNGNMLSVGDKIEGYELIKIQVGAATLVRGGKKLTLQVNEKYSELKK